MQPQIPFIASPNYHKGRRGGQTIRYIIIHAMIGSYEGTVEWFENTSSQVSAHYLISKKGEVTQMVKDQDSAWHVCMANPFCVGIELEDLSWGKDSQGRPRQLTSENDPNWFTISQLDVAAELTADLMKKYNVPLQNVIGHNDPLLKRYSNNHTDPGPYFPWIKFRSMVQDKLAQAA